MKKKLLTAGVSVILALSLVCAFAACDNTRDDGIFSEGVIAVADEYGLWGYVDSNGKVAIDCQYASATPFHNGVAAVQYSSSGVYYLIDKDGAHLAGPYGGVTFSRDGKWAVVAGTQSSADLYGIYDTAGKTAKTECVYDDISETENGYFLTVYETYISVLDPASGTTVAGPYTSGANLIGIQGKWIVTSESVPAETEGGADVTVYRVTDMTSGTTDERTFDGAVMGMGTSWTTLTIESADGTATQYILTDSAIIELGDGVTAMQTRDSSMLEVSSSSENADGAVTTLYTVYGEGGEVIYSGETQPAWNNTCYVVSEYDASAGLTVTVLFDGHKYSATASLPDGHTAASATEVSVYEDGAALMRIAYTIDRGEGLSENYAEVRLLIDGTLIELPENTSVVSVVGDKIALKNAATGRTGLFDKNLNEVVGSIYSGMNVTESGYVIVKMGDAYGVLAPDGSTVLECVYTGIAVA